MKGYIQVYTGNGKGKSTAAFGLALRAVGAGKKVFIAQFVKGQPYSELNAFKRLKPFVEVKQYGLGCFIVKSPTQKDVDVAQKGLKEVSEIIKSNNFDLVILDEANIALYYNLISVNELVNLLANKPDELEIVVTGRYAPDEIIEIADLVTEMKEVKHYYAKDVPARKGIEF
jgi:cob(I)alamin adenosyltransferase